MYEFGMMAASGVRVASMLDAENTGVDTDGLREGAEALLLGPTGADVGLGDLTVELPRGSLLSWLPVAASSGRRMLRL
jgi:hypothetical protein